MKKFLRVKLQVELTLFLIGHIGGALHGVDDGKPTDA